MATLELRDVSLSYNHQLVVRDLSFGLGPGELVGLIGPNGCGKTTVIKALSHVLPVRCGEVLLDGKDISRIDRMAMARLLGVVPQNPVLPETFTVWEVVLLGRNPHLGFLRGENNRDLAVVWWAMERTGIVSLSERRLSELSGGEKQRVTIARVLAQQPQVVLLDEPTANLDISHQIDILALIKELCREKQLAALIAIHDLNMAAQFCDRLILMNKGRLHAEGTPEEVITSDNIRQVYGAGSTVYRHPENGLPLVVLSTDSSAGTLDPRVTSIR